MTGRFHGSLQGRSGYFFGGCEGVPKKHPEFHKLTKNDPCPFDALLGTLWAPPEAHFGPQVPLSETNF